MKLKRIIMSTMATMLLLTTTATTYANEVKEVHKERHGFKQHHVKVMGEVKEVKKIDDNTTHILVDGYVNGNEVIKEEIILVVTEETKIVNSEILEKFKELHEKCKDNKEECKKEIAEIEKMPKVEIKKGDYVMSVISDVMTKSLPPQTVARFIKVTKVAE